MAINMMRLYVSLLLQCTCNIKEYRIAKGKLVVWLAIGEKVEWNCTCSWRWWCESGGKIVVIMKTKMQLLIGKKHLGNEWIYRKLMSAKFWTKMKLMLTMTMTHWRWLWKGFHCLPPGAAQKKLKTFSFVQVALAIRLKKFTLWQVNSTRNFISKANIALIHTRTISVFHVKFNMEFTCQAAHFSIVFLFTLKLISNRSEQRTHGYISLM